MLNDTQSHAALLAEIRSAPNSHIALAAAKRGAPWHWRAWHEVESALLNAGATSEEIADAIGVAPAGGSNGSDGSEPPDHRPKPPLKAGKAHADGVRGAAPTMSWFDGSRNSSVVQEVTMEEVTRFVTLDPDGRGAGQQRARDEALAAEERTMKETGDWDVAARSFKSVMNGYKANMQAVTFSSSFSKRTPPKRQADEFDHTGHYCFDYDGMTADECAAGVKIAAQMDGVRLAFVGPSGRGIKIVVFVHGAVPTDNEEHRRVYLRIAAHLDSTLGCKHDPAAKDVSRLCYLPHDPNAYVNADAALRLGDIPPHNPQTHSEQRTANGHATGTGTGTTSSEFEDPPLSARVAGAIQAIESGLVGGPYAAEANTRDRSSALTWALSQYVEQDESVRRAWFAKLDGDGRFAADRRAEGNYESKWAGNEKLTATAGLFVHLVASEAEKRGVPSPLPKGRRRANKGGRPRNSDNETSHAATRKRAQRAHAKAQEQAERETSNGDAAKKKAAMEEAVRLIDVAQSEQCDADRVLTLCPERLMRVVGDGQERVFVLGANGLWSELEHRRTDATTGALAVTAYIAQKRAIRKARDAGLNKSAIDDIERYWRRGSTAQEKGSLARQIAQRVAGREVEIKEVHAEALDDRTVRPIIPLTKGRGAWDIAAGCVIPPSEVAELMQTEKGWAMPMPVKGEGYAAEQMDLALNGRYAGLFERTAALITGTAKTVDIFICMLSNYGKTTFYDLLRRAFPGMVERIDARTAYHSSSMRFTPAAQALTSRLIVVLDECGHLEDDLPPAAINSHTDEYMTIEQKGQDVRTARRTGSLVLMGHKWPPIAVHAQGIDTRIRWVHKVDDDAEAMSQQERDILVSPEAIEQMRYRILERAQELMADPKGAFAASETDKSERLRLEFMRERLDPRVAALRTDYELATGGFVSNGEINETLDGWSQDGKPFPAKELNVLMQAAFGGGAKRKKKTTGDREWGWRGIQSRNQF